MPQDAPPPAVAIELTASTAGALVIEHNVTTDAAGGPDLLALILTVWPTPAADTTGAIGEVDALIETDDDALSCSFLGLDRADLDAVIAYLTGVRDQWQAAA
jgi:hypothetical protein